MKIETGFMIQIDELSSELFLTSWILLVLLRIPNIFYFISYFLHLLLDFSLLINLDLHLASITMTYSNFPKIAYSFFASSQTT